MIAQNVPGAGKYTPKNNWASSSFSTGESGMSSLLSVQTTKNRKSANQRMRRSTECASFKSTTMRNTDKIIHQALKQFGPAIG